MDDSSSELSRLPTRIEDIDMPHLPASELLGLSPDDFRPPGLRATDIDFDYVRWGHARALGLRLSDRRALETVVDECVLIALHSAGDQVDALAGDVDLEFFPDRESDASLLVGLARFLEVQLPRCVANHDPLPPSLVLVLCNPERRRPDAAWPICANLGFSKLHFADGDVAAWLDPPEDGLGTSHLRLSAERWHVFDSRSDAQERRP